MNLFRKLTALRRDQATPAAPSAIEPFGRVDTDDKRVGRWGLKVLLIGFGGFVLWAALAPLDEGVTANGSVIVASNRQTVQHLTGGSVEKLLVNEGDVVRKGQALLTLNDTEVRAQMGSILAQFITARAIEDRLLAEREGSASLRFSAELDQLGQELPGNETRVQQAKQLQTQLFHTRRDGLRDELQAQDENIKGLQEQLRGLQGMKAARAEQSKWQDKELEGIRDLAAGGYVPKNRLYQLERGAAEIRGQLADTISSIGRVQDGIAETRLRQLARKQDYQKEVESQLTDIQKETATLRDRLAAQRYVLRNSTIRAPLAGRVLGLKIHTVGGVVQAGQPLMEVVPENQPLLIEAMVDPAMSAKVHPGLPVDVSFPALNQQTTPVIPGEVATFSADRLLDAKTGMPYYLAQVKVTPAGMRLLGDQQVKPGMPASIVIKSGERTMLRYLLKPVLDRMNLAFKES